MCGIVGLYNVQKSFASAPEARRVLAEMTASVAHRGPDAVGMWEDPQDRCYLGHRRLSIIDTTEAGQQPMSDNKERWIIAFNGEVYNFLEVRQELEAKGIHLRGRTDTEVLVEAVALWDVDALTKLDGMFSFAAFDRLSGNLLLARDPFGEKPLYYSELRSGGFAFASELQALEKLPSFDAEISLDAMAEVLMFQYIGSPRTIYRSVKKLPPGHWMRITLEKPPQIGRFFKFRPEEGFDHRPLSALADELEDILVRSIRRRLISDVPLGAFLSGGVDSSTVCALIRKKLGLPLKTFSIGFRNASESEHKAARQLAKYIECEHHDEILSPDASSFLFDIGRVLDEPNGDSSCMPTYLLSQFARKQVTVAVSGDGGDEMFGGYGRYFTTLEEEKRAKQNGGWHPGHAYYSERILVSTEKFIADLFGSVPAGLAEHLKKLRDELADNNVPLLGRLRRTDVENYLPGAVLPKVDRMSMQHGLEVRTPYLNVEVARFVERLPLDALYRDGRGKCILREVAYRYLPRKLVNAPKKGFAIPTTSWANNELAATTQSLLGSSDSYLRKMFGASAIDPIIQAQKVGDGIGVFGVWGLAMLESWCRNHPVMLPELRPRKASLSKNAIVQNNEVHRDLAVAVNLGTKQFVVVDHHAALEISSGEKLLEVLGNRQVHDLMCLILSLVPDYRFATPQGNSRQPIIVPLKMDTEVVIDPDDLRCLEQATLFCIQPDAARILGWRECDALLRFGVSKIVMFHPHRSDHSIVILNLKRKTRLEEAASVRQMKRYRIASIRTQFLQPFRNDGLMNHAFETPLLDIPLASEEERSDRYAVFEGARQLPPIPTAHADISLLGNGRYSVWGRRCIVSSTHEQGRFPFWVIERSQQVDALLPMTVDIIENPPRSLHNFSEDLAVLLAESNQVASDDSPPIHGNASTLLMIQSPETSPYDLDRVLISLKKKNIPTLISVLYPLHGYTGQSVEKLRKHSLDILHIEAEDLPGWLPTHTFSDIARRLLWPVWNPFDLKLAQLTNLLVRVQPRLVIAPIDTLGLMAGTAVHIVGTANLILTGTISPQMAAILLQEKWVMDAFVSLLSSRRVHITKATAVEFEALIRSSGNSFSRDCMHCVNDLDEYFASMQDQHKFD